MVITKSTKLKKQRYDVPSPSGGDYGQPAIVIRGDNITVDFNKADIHGTPETVEPDQREGVGIQVEGKNVTIKNANVRGYKIALIARNCPGLKIIDSDFSYNWKQHLLSTLEREDESDWMSYHQNEKDEWLRYGAAMYLRGCDGFEVKNVKAEGGQCGLMLMECNKGLVWNNDFSFLSGIGLGMYKSSSNRIMHNKIDWCVRGYSHGVYNRGQDSAGILIYEQSSNNVFAYNSVTHGGDGFFLWAGQTTMDTGKGGCNDNLLYANDFSHAPTNGIEATFSRNQFVNNYVYECWHGVWGGYSYDSTLLYNQFGLNEVGMAIEHGQNNAIQGNLFDRDQTAIQLWMNKTQDPNWGYPKGHDTVSHDYQITGNMFTNNKLVLSLRDTKNVNFTGNDVQLVDKVFSLQGVTDGLVTTGNRYHAVAGLEDSAKNGSTVDDQIDLAFMPTWNPSAAKKSLPSDVQKYWVQPLKGGMNPFLPAGADRGRRYILVDQWGPYDFKSPLLWPRGSGPQSVEEAGRTPEESRPTVQHFEILGPPGKWKVVSMTGVQSMSEMSGNVPGFVDVTLTPGKAVDVNIVLQYTGEGTIDYRGVVTKKGDPVRFGFSKFFAPIDWTVNFFSWDEKSDPRTQEAAFRKVLAGKPLKTVQTDRLDYASGGAFLSGLPSDHFADVFEGTFEVPPGDYTINVTTDDGCRVYVDGKKVIDEWHYQGPTAYSASLRLGGQHKIRVEHFEIDGYSTIKVDLKPKK